MPNSPSAKKSKSNGFDKFDWHKALMRARLPHGPLVIAGLLFDHSSGDGTNARPGIKKLMEESGFSRRSVINHAASLRDLGWIFRTFHSNQASNRTDADVYKLTYPKDHPSSQVVDNSIPGARASAPGDARKSPDRVQNRDTTGCKTSPERVQELVHPTISSSPYPLLRRASAAKKHGGGCFEEVVPPERRDAEPGTFDFPQAAEVEEEFSNWTGNVGNPGW